MNLFWKKAKSEPDAVKTERPPERLNEDLARLESRLVARIKALEGAIAQPLEEIRAAASQNLTDMAAAVSDVQHRLDELREEIRKVNLGAGALADTKINSMITQTAHELMRLRQDTVNALQGIRNRADAADASVSKMASELELRIADGVAQASKQLPEAATST